MCSTNLKRSWRVNSISIKLQDNIRVLWNNERYKYLGVLNNWRNEGKLRKSTEGELGRYSKQN